MATNESNLGSISEPLPLAFPIQGRVARAEPRIVCEPITEQVDGTPITNSIQCDLACAAAGFNIASWTVGEDGSECKCCKPGL